jgi:hypothetical protein
VITGIGFSSDLQNITKSVPASAAILRLTFILVSIIFAGSEKKNEIQFFSVSLVVKHIQ